MELLYIFHRRRYQMYIFRDYKRELFLSLRMRTRGGPYGEERFPF